MNRQQEVRQVNAGESRVARSNLAMSECGAGGGGGRQSEGGGASGVCF